MQPGTACVAACYRCLMSYYNQPDHELIDRRDAARPRDLAAPRACANFGARDTASTQLLAPLDSVGSQRRGTVARRGLRVAGIPAPDREPLVVGDAVRALGVARALRRGSSIDAADRHAALRWKGLGLRRHPVRRACRLECRVYAPGQCSGHVHR